MSTDPHLWLEDVTGEAALAAVRGWNETTVEELTARPGFAPLRDRLLAILDADDRIPYVAKEGRYYYNFWRDAKNPRGLWRRTTLAEYRKPDPRWDVLLDLDALAAAEGENWVWVDADLRPKTHDRALVALSRGGADARVTREFDLATRSFVPDGFALPEAKGWTTWADADTLLVGTDTGPGSMTTSGYPRVVRRWRRGTPIGEAEIVYEGREDDVLVGAWTEHTRGYEREVVSRRMTFWTTEVFLVGADGLTRIDKPDDAIVTLFARWLYLQLRSDWQVGGRTFRAGALLALPLASFLAGDRDFAVLFEPTPRSSLAGFAPTRRHVVVNVLDNVRNRVDVLTPTRSGWHREALHGLPPLGTIGVSAVDAERSDALFLTVTDFLHPPSLYLRTPGEGAELLKQAPAKFDAAGLEVAQHEAVSADGTRVPYFQVSRRGMPLDGSNPTILYGYGGFEISLVPNYSAGVGAGWLERGGVWVVANIRGGGEFGPGWHQAALKQNRRRAYEDFAAVAEDLQRRGVTSPRHLGIQGGSNGGLLVGNLLVKRPELFRAVVCQVPLLDMKRYTKLLAGASWMGEYGDPDRDEDWAWLQAYSPYHNVRAGVPHPRVLFMTSTRDDRVHPGHARKMYARMRELGHDVLYYENIEGGHGAAADNRQAAFMWASAFTFFAGELG